jgi:hypothetical protein
MDRITAIITDLEPNHEIANRIRERGVRVISTQEDGVND